MKYPLLCDKCLDVGLRVAPSGRVEFCPTLQLDMPHADLSLTGERIKRAVESLWRRTITPDVRTFEIVRFLSTFTAEDPCRRDDLIDRFFSFATGAENRRRQVTLVIRELRDIWLVPVCSRKVRPAGYWIAIDEREFREWVDHAKAEPITTLSTIHRLARATFPIFAEQLELEFYGDIDKEAA